MIKTKADTGAGFEPPYPETTLPGPRLGISLGELQELNEWLYCPERLRAVMLYFYNLACRSIPAGSWSQGVKKTADILAVTEDDVRETLFDGWVLATDDRLYHPALVEIVKRDIASREGNRVRAERYRSKQKGSKRIKNDPAVPYADIVAAYNEILGNTNPECLQLNNTRRNRIKSLYKGDLTDLERWRQFFLYISGIPFLTGRTSSKGGKPFRPGIDWLTKPENYLKIKERGYE